MIWFLRHGDAAEGSPDAERPLTDKGREQSRVAGEALAALGVEPAACLTSPRVRASDTAALACAPLGARPQMEPRLSGGPFEPELLTGEVEGDVLLVGHEPDFSEAIRALTGARVKLKKGGLAAVQDDVLVALLRPRELRVLAAGGSA